MNDYEELKETLERIGVKIVTGIFLEGGLYIAIGNSLLLLFDENGKYRGTYLIEKGW